MAGNRRRKDAETACPITVNPGRYGIITALESIQKEQGKKSAESLRRP